MDMDKIIAIANEAYPDGLVEHAHKGERVYDGLAIFIATEIKEVNAGNFRLCSSDAQSLERVRRALENAERELGEVVQAFRDAESELTAELVYASKEEGV